MIRKTVILLLLLLPMFVQAQKMAKYVSGEKGSNDYEEITFWNTKNISYKPGPGNDISVTYLGGTIYQAQKAFILQLPGNKMVRVTAFDDGRIAITGLNCSYYKIFTWVNDGPRNNKNICLYCMVDKEEAMRMLKKVYI